MFRRLQIYTKPEVYALAKALDLPESIKNAIPTDGLWDVDRTDEQQIGNVS